jgi:MFS family permease
VAAVAGAVGFSFALGLSAVALPLLALAEGYSSVQIGVLTAISAAAQLVMRLGVGTLMRRYPDWVLVLLAALLLALSTAIVAISAALVPFVLCQLAQGAARGAWWTGSQTHGVRGSGPAVSALAKVNLSAGVGLLLGPLVAGLLAERSLLAALLLATGDAIAVAGTFRAGALFGSPLIVAALLGAIALGPAMALVGAVIATPALMARRFARADARPTGAGTALADDLDLEG